LNCKDKVIEFQLELMFRQVVVSKVGPFML